MRSAAVPKKCAYALSGDVCPERTWARRMVEVTMQFALQDFAYHDPSGPVGRRISDSTSDEDFAVKGIGPKAQLLKKSVWLLHLIGDKARHSSQVARTLN